MKLLTYKTHDSDEQRLGFIHNNQVIDMEDFGEISNFPLPSSMLELIDMGYELVEELNDMVADTEQAFLEEIAYEMDEVIFLAPIPKPRKNIIGIIQTNSDDVFSWFGNRSEENDFVHFISDFF